MTRIDKITDKILRGTSDSNINFNDLCNVLNKLGFQQRIKGSHHIFFKNDIDEIINIQPRLNKAKEYQVKQVREIIVKYKLLDK